MAEIIRELRDYTHLSWTLVRSSSGTAGSFLKSQEQTPRGKIYYKLSSFNSSEGVIGHESVNEIIADRLLTVLGIEHLSYQLIHARILVEGKPYETWICASGDFRRRGESKMALDRFYQAERSGPDETPLAFCLRMGWADYIWRMLVVDYLILNRDRHGANLEVMRDSIHKTVRLAPLFDHGLSFFCRCESEEALEREDVMADKPVQCFVGSRSARDNLNLIPRDSFPDLSPLREEHRGVILDGLDGIISERWQERVWEMIHRRWQEYETLRHPG